MATNADGPDKSTGPRRRDGQTNGTTHRGPEARQWFECDCGARYRNPDVAKMCCVVERIAGFRRASELVRAGGGGVEQTDPADELLYCWGCDVEFKDPGANLVRSKNAPDQIVAKCEACESMVCKDADRSTTATDRSGGSQ